MESEAYLQGDRRVLTFDGVLFICWHPPISDCDSGKLLASIVIYPGFFCCCCLSFCFFVFCFVTCDSMPDNRCGARCRITLPGPHFQVSEICVL